LSGSPCGTPSLISRDSCAEGVFLRGSFLLFVFLEGVCLSISTKRYVLPLPLLFLFFFFFPLLSFIRPLAHLPHHSLHFPSSSLLFLCPALHSLISPHTHPSTLTHTLTRRLSYTHSSFPLHAHIPFPINVGSGLPAPTRPQ